jgi:hypothetical protein
MTTPDIAGLCERLRARQDHAFHGRASGRPFNPDGPEAADTLERQAAEIERLREGLGDILNIAGGDVISVRVKIRARAALTGKDHD